MTVMSELLEQGKYPEAMAAFGLNLDQQKNVVERIQRFTAVNGQYELTGLVSTHPYFQDNVIPESATEIQVCTDSRTLRILLNRQGDGRPYLDYNEQQSDMRTCEYPTTCECDPDDGYDCARCDYGRSYCIQHHTYH